MLSQGSQNSAASGHSRGSSQSGQRPPKKNITSPFLRKRAPGSTEKKPKKYAASNNLIVMHVTPNVNIPGPGAIQSGFFLSCNGQFEQKMVEILYRRNSKPEFMQFIEDTGVVDIVFNLGREGSPMLNNTWPKKGLCFMHVNPAEGEGDPNSFATMEQVKTFVMEYVVPEVMAVNPVTNDRLPNWDDVTTYTTVPTFDQIINHASINDLIQRYYVNSQEDEHLPYVNATTFYQASKRNLYSFWTPSHLSHAFKTLHRLTNTHMDLRDHYPVDNNDGTNNDGDNNDGTNNDGVARGNVPGLLLLQAAAPANNLPVQQDAQQANVLQVANGENNAVDPLAIDPLEDSDDEGVVERPARRRRLNN